MENDIYSGDPKIILTIDGATILYTAGQPLMDQGLENLAFLSLFVPPGWVGNILAIDSGEILSSDFLASTKGPITLSKLSLIEQTAVDSLDDPVFGNVTAEATNPEGTRINVDILIDPPTEDEFKLRLFRNGQNWIFQKLNPANERL